MRIIIIIQFKNKALIEGLHGGHVACQEQYNIIPMGQNVHSNAKYFYCSCHATWPPCKTSIGVVKSQTGLTHTYLSFYIIYHYFPLTLSNLILHF